MNHTPGPWHTAGDQGVQIRSAKDQIAKVWTMRGNEWKANARLIAAAPEMLEALDKIACFAPGNGDVCEIIAKVARSAIAKATGDAA